MAKNITNKDYFDYDFAEGFGSLKSEIKYLLEKVIEIDNKLSKEIIVVKENIQTVDKKTDLINENSNKRLAILENADGNKIIKITKTIFAWLGAFLTIAVTTYLLSKLGLK